MDLRDQVEIPELKNVYKERWEGQVSGDSDYYESEPDDDGGTSDGLSVTSESELDSEEEDSDTDSEEGLELTNDQVDKLRKWVTEFRGADLSRRLAIIKNGIKWIEERWEPKDSFNRKKVEKLVRNYLYNTGSRRTLKLGRRWTFRDVVRDAHREELHNMALSLSSEMGGSPEYLRSYQHALKIVEASLTEETKLRYRARARNWSEYKPPPRQQSKMLDRNSVKILREFSRHVYNQFGMRIAILAGYCDKGVATATLVDINDRLGATSFKDRHENWAEDPFVEDFRNWTAECFGGPSNADNNEGAKKIKKVLSDVKLKADAEGYPILPSWETIKDDGLLGKKLLIGKFLSEIQQITIGGGKGRIPWTHLQQVQDDYILPEYLPAGVTLQQYHRIHLSDVNALLEHWTTRQTAGKIPFRFKKPVTVPRHPVPVSAQKGPSKSKDNIGKAQEQEEDRRSSDLNDAQEGDEATEDPGPSTRLRPQNRRISGHSVDNAAEKQVEPSPTPPPFFNQPHSVINNSQSNPAAEQHSPQSLLGKPWSDKFKYLLSLTEDGKYLALIREINKTMMSNRAIYVSPSAYHPAWARWTWNEPWLPEEFHSGGDEPAWEWLQSRPYVPKSLPEVGLHSDFPVDSVALGIGCLLRDMEAMQFAEERHPPEHVENSQVRFDVMWTIIHPALDDFQKVVRDHNNNILTDDHQMQLAAPPSTSLEQQRNLKRRRKSGDQATDNTQIQNRQRVDEEADNGLPQTTRRSTRAVRLTELARAMQEDHAAASTKKNRRVLGVSRQRK